MVAEHERVARAERSRQLGERPEDSHDSRSKLSRHLGGRHRQGLVALLAALLVAGCQIILFSWPAGEPVPNVLGAWQGLWLQSPPLPLHVVITAQEGTRVSGIVTYQGPSGGVSTGIRGEFGIRNGRRVLLMTAAGLDRTDDFELTTLEPDRLEGRGAGSGLGGQRGPVTLRRP